MRRRPPAPTAQESVGDPPPLPRPTTPNPVRYVPPLLGLTALIAAFVVPQFSKPLITCTFAAVGLGEAFSFVERRRWKAGLTSLDVLSLFVISALILATINVWTADWEWWALGYVGVTVCGSVIYLLVSTRRDLRRAEAMAEQARDALAAYQVLAAEQARDRDEPGE